MRYLSRNELGAAAMAILLRIFIRTTFPLSVRKGKKSLNFGNCERSRRRIGTLLLRGLRVRLAMLVTVVVTSTKIHQLPRSHRILYLSPFATCAEVPGLA
jgi:hypothetical protein